MTSDHDVKVSFGIEASQVNRKIIIQRHNVYLKFKMAVIGHIRKLVRPLAHFFCRRNYYDAYFLANLKSTHF